MLWVAWEPVHKKVPASTEKSSREETDSSPGLPHLRSAARGRGMDAMEQSCALGIISAQEGHSLLSRFSWVLFLRQDSGSVHISVVQLTVLEGTEVRPFSASSV